MRRVGNQQQFFFEYGYRHEVGGFRRTRDHAEVAGARSQHGDGPLGTANRDLHIQVRVHAPDFGQQRWEDIQAHGHAADQPHRPTQRLAFVADGRYRFLEVPKDAVTELKQRFAGWRNPDAAPDAMKYRLAEFFFEQEDLAADRRLRDMQLLAGGGERAGVGDGADDLQLPKIHGVRIL